MEVNRVWFMWWTEALLDASDVQSQAACSRKYEVVCGIVQPLNTIYMSIIFLRALLRIDFVQSLEYLYQIIVAVLNVW